MREYDDRDGGGDFDDGGAEAAYRAWIDELGGDLAPDGLGGDYDEGLLEVEEGPDEGADADGERTVTLDDFENLYGGVLESIFRARGDGTEMIEAMLVDPTQRRNTETQDSDAEEADLPPEVQRLLSKVPIAEDTHTSSFLVRRVVTGRGGEEPVAKVQFQRREEGPDTERVVSITYLSRMLLGNDEPPVFVGEREASVYTWLKPEADRRFPAVDPARQLVDGDPELSPTHRFGRGEMQDVLDYLNRH
ncbi:MAG TPA: hypothetical protein VFM05_12060 [Candidatus Saccharimonadales bacterium]|nr:hypothetical protein [Candidatus Saccharimonadales bacterium]